VSRTAITVIAPALNAAVVDTPPDIDQANGMYVPASVPTRDVLVRVLNSTAGAKNVTFKAGDNPPALAAGQGDLVVAMAQDAVKFVHLESARFLQSDGTIEVDFEAGMTGEIAVIRKLRSS